MSDSLASGSSKKSSKIYAAKDQGDLRNVDSIRFSKTTARHDRWLLFSSLKRDVPDYHYEWSRDRGGRSDPTIRSIREVIPGSVT